MRLGKLARGARWALVLAVAGLAATVGVVLASEGGTTVALCLPAKEGKPIITPKGGICKTGYALSEVNKEGPEGKPGAEGKQGPEGRPGAEGPAGPFPKTLPAGQTLTGTYAVTGGNGNSSHTGSDWGSSAISFLYPLAKAPTAKFVRLGATVSGCSGTPSNPTAESGVLCVYEGTSSGVNIEAAPPICTPSGCGFGNFSGTTGAVIRMIGTADNQRFYDWGSWAVTG